MERARIIVRGEVQKVGFRGFVIEQMKSLKLNGYAENLPDGTVGILCEGKRERIEGLITQIKEIPPHFARVDSIKEEWQKYIGDLKEPERRGEDIPRKATLDDLLKVMQSFDKKAEVLNERFRESVITLKAFKEESGKKQDKMLDELDSFHRDTIERFDNLDTKYGRIADIMEKLTEALLKLAEKR